MKFTCPKCKAMLVVPDEKLKSGAVRFKCSSCGATISGKQKGPKAPPESASEPGLLPPQPPTKEPEISLSPVLPESERQPLPKSSPPVDEELPGLILPVVAKVSDPEAYKEPKRLKKTQAAHGTSMKYSPSAKETGSKVSRKVFLAATAAGLLVTVLAAIFFLSSQSKDMQNQRSSASPTKALSEVQPSDQKSLPQSGPSLAPASEESRSVASTAQPSSTYIPSEITDEKAIEIVKKSNALMKMTTVEAIVDKWTTDNSGKYSIVGWQAKKIDEQKYLVSYTAVNGESTTGFYFDLDIQTGAVKIQK